MMQVGRLVAGLMILLSAESFSVPSSAVVRPALKRLEVVVAASGAQRLSSDLRSNGVRPTAR